MYTHSQQEKCERGTCVGCSVRQSVAAEMQLLPLMLSPILFSLVAFTVDCVVSSTDDGDDEVMLNVLRCQLTYQGQAEANAEARFSIALRPRKPEGSLGRTAQDGHLDSHTQLLNYDV